MGRRPLGVISGVTLFYAALFSPSACLLASGQKLGIALFYLFFVATT